MTTNKEIIKALKEATLVMVCGVNSDVYFSVSKALAKTIIRKAELSQNFRYRISGATLILEI